MQIAKTLAGFSGPKADDLRKAIGKKNREAMAKLKPEFFEGCRASGTAPDVIEWLWATNEKSADYCFNKSHAACYALISYRTAWLKANYPAEYMAALISSVMDTKDKVPFFVNQAESMGIEILPPDVNLSDHEFVVVEGNIRFGLDAVKGVGYAAVEAIKAARDDGRPVHVAVGLLRARRRPRGEQEGDRGADQVRRVRLDGRDPQGHARRARVGAGGGPEGAARRADRPGLDLRPRRLRRRGRRRATPFAGPTHPPIPIEEFDRPSCSAIEKESIGIFITEHPLKRVRDALRVKGDTLCTDVAGAPRRRVGEGRRDDLGVEEDQDALGLDGDVRDARRPRRPGRAARVREGDPRAARRRSRPTRSCSSAAPSTTARTARSASRSPTSRRSTRPTPRSSAPATRPPRSPPPARRGRCTCASTPAACPASVIDELKRIFDDFPGESEVVLEVHTRTGPAPAALRRTSSRSTAATRRSRPSWTACSATRCSRRSRSRPDSRGQTRCVAR